MDANTGAKLIKVPSGMKNNGMAKGLLSPQQMQCVELVVEGKTNKEIAEEVGIHVETLYRWRKQRLFSREVAKRSKEVAKASLEILKANVTHATQRLVEMIDEEKPSQTRFAAAMAVIKIVYENQMLEDLQNQVRDLEAVNREP